MRSKVYEYIDIANQIAPYNFVTIQLIILYLRIMKRMCLYLHKKQMCAYKRAAPNNDVRLYWTHMAVGMSSRYSKPHPNIRLCAYKQCALNSKCLWQQNDMRLYANMHL